MAKDEIRSITVAVQQFSRSIGQTMHSMEDLLAALQASENPDEILDNYEA